MKGTRISGMVLALWLLAAPVLAAVPEDFACRGVALGATYHVVGATRAMDIGETEGAMAGLCIGLAGIITVILMPFAVLLL